jgi:hypothetical protein
MYQQWYDVRATVFLSNKSGHGFHSETVSYIPGIALFVPWFLYSLVLGKEISTNIKCDNEIFSSFKHFTN